jgi:hypothetical protein
MRIVNLESLSKKKAYQQSSNGHRMTFILFTRGCRGVVRDGEGERDLATEDGKVVLGELR